MSGTVVRKIIHSAFAPAAIGPYSQAVLVDKTLYVSGQLGLDTATGALVPGGVEAEAKRALDNMGHILQAAGISYNNDFSENFPARAAYQVAALPKGGRVEIEAIAVVGTVEDSKL